MAHYNHSLPDNTEFVKVSSFAAGDVIEVKGFLKYETKYGTTTAIIGEDKIITLPKGKNEDVIRAMLSKSTTDLINNGQFIAEVIEYTNSYGTFKTVEFYTKE